MFRALSILAVALTPALFPAAARAQAPATPPVESEDPGTQDAEPQNEGKQNEGTQNEGKQDESKQDELPPLPRVLRYPENADVVLATLDGHPVRLVELGRYLQQRYDPDILERWARPEGQRELNSPNLGELLWQYLDVLALRKEAEAKGLPMAELQAAVDKTLERAFEEKYVPRYEKATGRKITEESRDWYEKDHRRKSGLRAEVECLLNGLVPRLAKVSELMAFHREHGDYFGGKVLVAHIHFATRDPRTGRRYAPEKLAELRGHMRDVQRMLEEDPTRFEALAQKFSDDRVSGEKGGEIGWVTRFDERLPAAVVRAAWSMEQGAFSAPVETFFGYHIVQRRRFVQHHFLLPRKESYHKIAAAVQKVQQEDYLFAMRQRHARKVRY